MTTTTLPEALRHLETALDALADALAGGRADAVLTAEAPLASAVDHLLNAPRTVADAAAVRTSIDASRRLLARCRALGETADALAAATFPGIAYARDGAQHADAPRGLQTALRG